MLRGFSMKMFLNEPGGIINVIRGEFFRRFGDFFIHNKPLKKFNGSKINPWRKSFRNS